MAVFRARAVAVAAGVPAAFAMLAGLLTVASPLTEATAAEPRSATSAAQPFGVTRELVRPQGPAMAALFHVGPTAPVVFITIDDGVTKDRAGLRYVEKYELPVTAFVTAWTVKDRADYFTRITRWGSVQNHSATHASLARSTTDLDHEICYTQRLLARDFGTAPWMLRPPYGAGATRMETQVTADRCGITDLVLWDAVVEDGVLSTTGNGLRPGSVILLHFTPNLEEDLKAAVHAARKAGLAPANLADYLPSPAPRRTT